MTTKLKQAMAAIERLPQERQDEIAAALLETATRAMIDEKIAAGEASYAQSGGTPAADVFARLIRKYAS